MTKTELVKRYGCFGAGLIVTSYGIALTTLARLGTSPISSIPYTLSLLVPRLTLGSWTIAFNMLLIVLQSLMQRRGLRVVDLALQIVLTFAFGFVIDSACFTLRWLHPQAYRSQLAVLLIGCFVLAFGIFFQFTGGVVMLPGDGFSRTIARISGKNFGSVRMICDISMAGIALALGLIIMHRPVGIREGTLIAALLIGNIVRLYTALLRPAVEKFLPGANRARLREQAQDLQNGPLQDRRDAKDRRDPKQPK
ncbi:MAG: YczE/YyaS/YitT family protein [Anaerovoracaceae bacterium]|jgi:uncharacterized membrane protein YczE